jgi:hypothetical protein
MPILVREKSYFTGSSGEKSRNTPLISTAVFKSACFLPVNPRRRVMRSMWVSTGTMSFAGSMFQPPGSISSCRTIQRRKRNIRLQALFPSGEARRLPAQ